METNFIKSIVSQNRKSLLFTYTLVLLEKLGELSIPFFLGLSIDGLTAHKYTPLFYLVVTYVLWILIATFRHKYDTKCYTDIYNKIVLEIFSKEKSLSKVSAYTNLCRELVDFFEFDMVYIATAFINIIGSLFMISLYSFDVVILCLTLMLPVIVISKKYGYSMYEWNKKKNSELEKQVDVISTGDFNQAKRHFSMLRILQIRLSNKEANNYWQLQMISLVLLITSLIIISFKSNLEPGTLVSVWSYLLIYLNGLEIIPYSIQKWTNLKDIVSRIKN